MHRDAPGLWCGMRYSFSIRNGDGSVREDLGSTDLLSDYVAHVFCDDVIRQMLPGNPDQHIGCTMDVMQGERPVCSVAFP
jgi:hypothetical protein